MGVRLLVGTAKGGFWVTSDDRREWAVEGPFFKGWKVTAGLRLAGGGWMAAVASDILGRAVSVGVDYRRDPVAVAAGAPAAAPEHADVERFCKIFRGEVVKEIAHGI